MFTTLTGRRAQLTCNTVPGYLGVAFGFRAVATELSHTARVAQLAETCTKEVIGRVDRMQHWLVLYRCEYLLPYGNWNPKVKGRRTRISWVHRSSRCNSRRSEVDLIANPLCFQISSSEVHREKICFKLPQVNMTSNRSKSEYSDDWMFELMLLGFFVVIWD
jgi:hypothetical protein